MNIIEAAIRRILIKETEKAIRGTAKNLAENASNSQPKVVMPSFGSLVLNLIITTILIYILTNIFIWLNVEIAYIIPLFFAIKAFKSLFVNYKYGLKKVGVYKQDRRYKTGQRLDGFKLVEDKENKIYYNKKQSIYSKLEGGLKLFVIGFSVFMVYVTFNSNEHKIKNLSEKETIKLLSKGDTLFANSSKTDFYGKFHDKLLKKTEFEECGLDSVQPLGIFIGLDSVQSNSDTRLDYEKDKHNPNYEEFKPEYERMLIISPFNKIVAYKPMFYELSNRLNKKWYVDFDDINIGVSKYISAQNTQQKFYK